MEVRRIGYLLGLSLLMVLPGRLRAQEFTIMNNRMYVTVPKHLSPEQLDSFEVRFDLSDLNLRSILQKGKFDRLRKMGWRIEKNTAGVLQISRQVLGLSDMTNPEKRIKLTEEHPTFAEMFPIENDNLKYGYNRFVHKHPFLVRDSMVTFYMRGHLNARQVQLAGSFTNWQFNALSMNRTDSGWIMVVKLGAGKYWYKFIIDGGWTTDPDNDLHEDDGRGNMNSVYFKPNYTFTLNRFRNAREVYLSGNFNNWLRHDIAMEPTATGWEVDLYLAAGTHTYKYIVDGTWYADPDNPNQLPDGERGFNSVVRIGKPRIFFLKGYGTAQAVFLAGSFNDWKREELSMKKTAEGWTIPYTLGPGNYTYRFFVDGKGIPDPANPYFVNQNGKSDSYLIVSPNFTFRLHGYGTAEKVYLAGDFNNWTPNSLSMKRIGDEWIFSVHLSVGKHLYKFIVDSQWMIDPGNQLWEDNEYGTNNSVIWIEH